MRNYYLAHKKQLSNNFLRFYKVVENGKHLGQI